MLGSGSLWPLPSLRVFMLLPGRTVSFQAALRVDFFSCFFSSSFWYPQAYWPALVWEVWSGRVYAALRNVALGLSMSCPSLQKKYLVTKVSGGIQRNEIQSPSRTEVAFRNILGAGSSPTIKIGQHVSKKPKLTLKHNKEFQKITGRDLSYLLQSCCLRDQLKQWSIHSFCYAVLIFFTVHLGASYVALKNQGGKIRNCLSFGCTILETFVSKKCHVSNVK